MSLISKVKKAAIYYKGADKKKMFSTMKAVHKLYGLHGLKVAIGNKANGRPLLLNLEQIPINGSLNIGASIDYNDIGESIFKEQQEEYSKEEIEQMIESMEIRPLISIIMPMYNPPIKWLVKAIESLQNQYYENWELCIVDDGSKDGRGASTIEKMAEQDSRIRFFKMSKNAGISAASNIALEMCTGEYVALIDQDDEITLDALFWVAKEINENRDVEFIYTDECKIDCGNTYTRFDFFFKPDWSPSMLINSMYSGHLTVYKTELVRQVGGFRSEYDFSQDYDLALRISEVVKNVSHIERVLYYWRALPTSGAGGGKDYARISNLGALQDWYKRQGMDAVMENLPRANYGRIQLKTLPKVSIVIPTDSYDNLKQCIQGLICNTSYTNIEIIPVTNSKLAEVIEEEYSYLECMKICHYNKVYNFSDKCNDGAKVATGEIVVFYNDDVIPFSRDWIEKQIEILEHPNVGGVSPLLIYENQTIQYAGMITGTPGLIGTSFNGRHYLDVTANAYHHLLLRDVSVLCGACTVMKKDVFFEVGGFDAINTPNGQSDLDLSLKLIDNGYRCIYTPYAILTHIGNHSWAAKNKADKADIFCLKKWGKYLSRDMYFTDSMKRMFYGDFTYKHKIYSPQNLIVPSGENSKDILFLTHELTRTGAPVVLKEMVKIALEKGDFPVVLCPVDGPLKEEFLEMGVTVIIDESFIHGHWIFEHFARNFDLVVANTLACANAIKLMEDSLPPVLWWIHEGTFALKHFENILPHKLGKNIHVYCVSEYVRRTLESSKFKYKSEILTCGLGNIEIDKSELVYNQYKFLIIGSLEERKGQDIMIKAIKRLPESYRKKAEFIFIGNVLEEEVYESVKLAIDEFSNVKYLGSIKHDQVLELYKTATCSVIPSRDEPLSLIGIESMIFNKTCICSDATGISDYIKDGVDGLIFESENDKELAEKIIYVMEHTDSVKAMGEKGHQIFLNHFTNDIYKQKLSEIFKELKL